jgi:hypothetical protein
MMLHHIFHKQWQDSVMVLATTQRDIANLKIVSSCKLLQASEGRIHFILACPCKSKHLSQRYREAHIEGPSQNRNELQYVFEDKSLKTLQAKP